MTAKKINKKLIKKLGLQENINYIKNIILQEVNKGNSSVDLYQYIKNTGIVNPSIIESYFNLRGFRVGYRIHTVERYCSFSIGW